MITNYFKQHALTLASLLIAMALIFCVMVLVPFRAHVNARPQFATAAPYPSTPPDITLGTNNCSTDGNYCGFVNNYLNPIINFLAVGFGIIASISLVISGIQYSASQGDPQRIAAAKKRIVGTIIAIITFALMYSLLQFLVPGGLFKT